MLSVDPSKSRILEDKKDTIMQANLTHTDDDLSQGDDIVTNGYVGTNRLNEPDTLND